MEFEPQLGVLPGPMDDGLKIYDYSIARRLMTARRGNPEGYPCVFINWDNTPRRGANGIVFINATPEYFEAGLREGIQSVINRPPDERIVFVNAWNEWAEGNDLEPDLKHGLAYLEAVRRASSDAAVGSAVGPA